MVKALTLVSFESKGTRKGSPLNCCLSETLSCYIGGRVGLMEAQLSCTGLSVLVRDVVPSLVLAFVTGSPSAD